MKSLTPRIACFTAVAAMLLAACGGPKDETTNTEATDASAPDVKAPAAEALAAPTHESNATPATTFVAVIRQKPPLGLPPVPTPADNPITEAKVRLGEILFNDKRFSATGEVSCATCHDPAKAFTDSPLSVSKGINDLTGTRNAPTIINAAYLNSQFWDGRRPSLEEQSQDPFLNPVEMALPSHQPILQIIRTDAAYDDLFQAAFGVSADAATIDHVKKAIASFERVVIAGGSPFDRFYFADEEDAISVQAKRGFDIFLNKGRCVSCHTISQTHALFTDNKFHNLGVGFSKIADDMQKVVGEFLRVANTDQKVDEAVLGDANISEIGRFAVSREMQDIGQFKTPTLRNIAATAPYMHDGGLQTLRQVVELYNTTISPLEDQTKEANPFQSGGIRPLDLTDAEIDDLVAFLKTLTSPQFEDAAKVSLAAQAQVDAAMTAPDVPQ